MGKEVIVVDEREFTNHDEPAEREGHCVAGVIQQGDLTEMETDAIVNAANNDLVLERELRERSAARAGRQSQRECDAIGSIPLDFAPSPRAASLRLST